MFRFTYKEDLVGVEVYDVRQMSLMRRKMRNSKRKQAFLSKRGLQISDTTIRQSGTTRKRKKWS